MGVALLSNSSLSNPTSAAHTSLDLGADIQQTTEANGLSLTIARLPESALVSGTITVRWGSADQPAGKRADTHILEHVWFLATRGRETGEVDRLLEDIGATVNAATSRDAIIISFTVTKTAWRDAFVLITERMLRPDIRASELRAEKTPFLTEVALLQEDSHRNLLDILLSASVGPSFGASTGEPRRLASPDIEDIATLQKEIVTAPHISVALAGDIDREDARVVVNACFSDVPGEPTKRSLKDAGASARITTIPLTAANTVATAIFIPTSNGKSGIDLAVAHAADLAVVNVIQQALRSELVSNLPASKNAMPMLIDASCSSVLHRGLTGVIIRIDHMAVAPQPVDKLLVALKAAQKLLMDESHARAVLVATRRLWAEQATQPSQVVARQSEWDSLDEPGGPVLLLKSLSDMTPARLSEHIDRLVLRFTLRQEVKR